MRFASFAEGLAFLEKRSIMPVTAPSLEPMRRALARAPWAVRGSGAAPRRNVIIAGTNGKGSTAATLSALLHSAGARVGLYTSPHLVSVCERFRVSEADIDEALFLEALHANLACIESESLTHFEALTLIAAWIFLSGEAIAPCDWNIWEVGLGGLWDATNALPHHFCGITRLGYDHEGLLGHTLPEIARQKFGVIPAGGLVAYSPMEASLALLRDEFQRATGCRWVPAPACESDGWRGIRTPWGAAELALAGPRAAENTALALALFAQLGFDPAPHLPALNRVRWPGRFQAIRWRGREVYLSGDHNPQGVESLLAILRGRSWRGLRIVLGVCADKEVASMGEALLALPGARLYLTETPFKTLPLAEYPASLRARAAGADAEVARLLDRVVAETGAGDLTLVTGSLYLVGKVLEAAESRTLPS